MSEMKLYQQALFYDLAFARDYVGECDFLEWLVDRHATAGERSLLELGCGPAGHIRELARRGFRTVGLDLAPSMVAYAAAEAAREGLKVEVLEADMTAFRLTRPVAAAVCLMDTIAVLTTDERVIALLRSVADNLLPGGIFILEIAHPRSAALPYTGRVRTAKHGDLDIECVWGLPDDAHDAATLEGLCTIRLVVRDGDAVVLRDENVMRQRYLREDDLRALIDASGVFSATHWYGRMDLPPTPFGADDRCDDMVVVMIKR